MPAVNTEPLGEQGLELVSAGFGVASDFFVGLNLKEGSRILWGTVKPAIWKTEEG